MDNYNYYYDMLGETFLRLETIIIIGDAMKRLISIVIVLMIVALSGCTDQEVSTQPEGQTFERANLNLDGKMMSIELTPTDARAGENITAKLVVGNTGTENVISETIEIQAKARSLNDFFANLALTAMSNEKKTMTFTTEFTEEIKPGMIKTLTRVFSTPRELKGRNLAGNYDITVILSVNGQRVESKTVKLKLSSGTPRDIYNTQEPASTVATTATANPAPTVIAAPTATPTPTSVPTPELTQEVVTVDTYLFSWDDVPGKDDAKLIEYLKKRFSLDWIDNAVIEKTVDSKAIKLTSDKKYVSLELVGDLVPDVKLTISDGRTEKYILVFENGKRNIYSGKFRTTRIKDSDFGDKNIKIEAGDWLQWQNYDAEETYTLVESDGKLPNQTLSSRINYYFNTTGTYTFRLFYPKMRGKEPPVQTLIIEPKQS